MPERTEVRTADRDFVVSADGHLLEPITLWGPLTWAPTTEPSGLITQSRTMRYCPGSSSLPRWARSKQERTLPWCFFTPPKMSSNVSFSFTSERGSGFGSGLGAGAGT